MPLRLMINQDPSENKDPRRKDVVDAAKGVLGGNMSSCKSTAVGTVSKGRVSCILVVVSVF